jgi:hypothetical protein
MAGQATLAVGGVLWWSNYLRVQNRSSRPTKKHVGHIHHTEEYVGNDMFLNLSKAPKGRRYMDTYPLHHFLLQRNYYSDVESYSFGYLKCYALPEDHQYSQGQIDFVVTAGRNICISPLPKTYILGNTSLGRTGPAGHWVGTP